ncbi:MobA/MobL protein (plasmid) [Thalassoporum mexicanum PCC 7367]|uniref:MobQ family relaxase n=1 Tax=Thalassoporum mexicanum TaxID=3457544 RepID=UPI00029FF03E|nr:MobQ family relaxase [Pseudanabaena sp. PCC 7367]AFY71970.1 MobA/MobL protein [Pseudanabaena sp. PCC 7367]
MAIYHFEFKRMSRGKGRNAVACAAYRAGTFIQDSNTGINHDYSRKSGVYGSDILAPDYAPDWAHETKSLWNQVEKSETRSNALVATENLVALPIELTPEQNRQLVRDFVRDAHVPAGRIAEVFYHDLESHNPHAHILLSVRQLENGKFKTKPKAWDQTGLIYKLRESWCAHINQAMEAAGHEIKVDHRSLKERGMDRIPQVHLGPKVCKLEKMGVKTEWGDRYREIEAANQQLDQLNGQIKQVAEEKRKLDAELRELTQANTSSAMEIGSLSESNAKADKDLERTKPQLGAQKSTDILSAVTSAETHNQSQSKARPAGAKPVNALVKRVIPNTTTAAEPRQKLSSKPSVEPKSTSHPVPTDQTPQSQPNQLKSSNQRQKSDLQKITQQVMLSYSGNQATQERDRRLELATQAKATPDRKLPAYKQYFVELGQMIKRKGQGIYHSADRLIAQKLAQRGYSKESIRNAIARASPELMNQAPEGRKSYIRRLVQRVTEKVHSVESKQDVSRNR